MNSVRRCNLSLSAFFLLILLLHPAAFADEETPLRADSAAAPDAPVASLERDPNELKNNSRLHIRRNDIPLDPASRWIVTPGELITVQARTESLAPKERLVLSLWDWRGRRIFSEFREGSEDRASSTEFEITFRPESRGVWMITLDTYSGGDAESLNGRVITSFAALPTTNEEPARMHGPDEYLFGSCFFPLRYYRWGEAYTWPDDGNLPQNPDEAVRTLARLAARAGFTILRTDTFNYNADEGWPSDWTLYRRIASIMAEEGIRPFLKYDISPNVFLRDGTEPNPEHMDRWREDLSVFLNEVAGDPSIAPGWVSLGNEPAHREFWSGTQEQYLALYRLVSEAFAKTPDAPLLMQGGTAPPAADRWKMEQSDPEAYARTQAEMRTWYQAYYQSLVPRSPLWAYHFHGALTPDNLQWRRAEETVLQSLGMSPGGVFQAEGGACAWRPDLEVTTTNEVLHKLLYSMGNREAGWIHYKLVGDSAPGRYRTDPAWGILDGHTLAPKFQFAALAALIHLTEGPRKGWVVWQKEDDQGIAAVVSFETGFRTVLAFFSSGNDQQVQIRGDLTGQFFDLMGNPQEKVSGGITTLQLASEPRYLVLEGKPKFDLQ